MSTALFIKTESTDNYIWSWNEDLTLEEALSKAAESMGDEFEYMAYYEYTITPSEVNHDQKL